MGYFPATIAAQLRGSTVRLARLVEFDFADGPERLWEGTGDLAAGGNVWRGAGEMASISSIESALDGTAPVVTFTLSGVEPRFLARFLDQKDKVKGRDVTVFLQFFDADWSPLDDPYAIYVGVLDVMTLKQQGQTWTIAQSSESLFTRRGRPPWGYLSHESQTHRYPGDLGFDDVPQMRNRTVVWPSVG